MKRILFFVLLCASVFNSLMAQQALMIRRAGGVIDAVPTSLVDSISFRDGASVMMLATTGGETFDVEVRDIVDLSLSEAPAALTVQYEGEAATVLNPYFTQGVSVTIDGADVTISNTNTTEELTFELSGETSGGSLLYQGSYKATFVLNGVSITNPKGPAIDIECGKRIALELKKNTVNTLADGKDGDWKAALYCKGHLEIDKAGTLNVTGNTKHAISAKEYIQLKKAEGAINILGAKSDGIHCGQYFLANGYALTISGVAADGIQAEASGDEAYDGDLPDGSLWIQGGTFDIKCSGDDAAGLKADTELHVNAEKSVPVIGITMTGAGSKGVKANAVIVQDGDITVTNSGTAIAEGTDVQTAKCISADASAELLGGKLTLKATGAGGKGIKSDGTITIGNKENGEGPVMSVTTTGSKYSSGSSSGTGGNTGGGRGPGGWGGGGGWNPGGGGGMGGSSSGSSAKAIKAMGAIDIYGGELTISTATEGAEGIESKKSINIAGGKNYLKCYDDGINCSGQIAFNGGITVCCSTGNDAVDSNYGRAGALVIGDGILLTYTTKGGAEMGFDCDGNSYIQITGKGICISAGGNQGGSSSSTLSTASQGYAFVTTSISYQTGRYYTLADNSGKNLVTYSFEGNLNSSCALFTATGMVKGSTYTVKYSTQAPTDATTTFHGLYLGSSAKGTTSVTSFTAK